MGAHLLQVRGMTDGPAVEDNAAAVPCRGSRTVGTQTRNVLRGIPFIPNPLRRRWGHLRLPTICTFLHLRSCCTVVKTWYQVHWNSARGLSLFGIKG